MTQLVSNGLVVGLITGFGVLHALNPDLYYQHVQEDQPLEWMTFWAFILAAAFYFRASKLERRAGRLPWFLVGLVGFCLVVAMEEISWGQRLFGYQPPRYFLEQNYQQELNLHNVLATGIRKNLVAVIIAGYGLALPLLQRLPRTAPLFTKLQLHAPPATLAPAFLALLATYLIYPWRYTGEIVEAGMALAFLFSAMGSAQDPEVERPAPKRWVLGATVGLVVALGLASALYSRGVLAAEPITAQVTETEIHALQTDIAEVMGSSSRLCGHHERLTHFSRRRGASKINQGRFAGLTSRGLAAERAEFFIDPWSTAYWVRTTCNDEREKVFLYSFGPNRRRDSSRWKLGGDDIGVVFRIPKDRKTRPAMARRD